MSRLPYSKSRQHRGRQQVSIKSPIRAGPCRGKQNSTDLERQPGFDILLERFRNRLIKVAQDLHRELRVDALVADEVIERVGQGEPDTITPRKGAPMSASNSLCRLAVWSLGGLIVPAPTVELVERLRSRCHACCDAGKGGPRSTASSCLFSLSSLVGERSDVGSCS